MLEGHYWAVDPYSYDQMMMLVAHYYLLGVILYPSYYYWKMVEDPVPLELVQVLVAWTYCFQLVVVYPSYQKM
jgi:predicted transporter